MGKEGAVKSSQVYLYSAFLNIDCIKAASLYQSKHSNNVRFLVEKTSTIGRADQGYY